MTTRLFAAIASMALLIGMPRAQATTYDINVTFGPTVRCCEAITITGTITTDGTTGAGFTAADITDYNLVATIFGAGPSATFLGPLSGNNSSLTYTGGLLVTPASISFGSAAGSGQFALSATPFPPPFLSLNTGGFFELDLLDGAALNELPALQQMGLAVTPLPAALPLFGAGLGVIGLFARRGKRKKVSSAA